MLFTCFSREGLLKEDVLFLVFYSVVISLKITSIVLPNFPTPHTTSPQVQTDPSQESTSPNRPKVKPKIHGVWGIMVGHIGSKRLHWIFNKFNFYGASPQSQLEQYFAFTMCGENLLLCHNFF